MSRNNQRDHTINQNDNTHQRLKTPLLSDDDAKRAGKVTVYMIDQAPLPTEESMHKQPTSRENNRSNPSIVLPTLSPDHHNRQTTRPHGNTPPKHQQDREVVRLPSITHRYEREHGRPPPITHRYEREHGRPPSITHRYYPYEHFNGHPNYYQPEHLNYPYVVQLKYRSPHHYRYNERGETHDPRWWYMPPNSVHGPKLRRTVDSYSPPKWYEVPHRR